MKKLLIITVLFTLGFMSSCKKDEVVLPKKDLLTAKTWIIDEVLAFNTAKAYKRGGDPKENVYDLTKVVFNFKSDGTLSGVDNNGKAVTGAKWAFSTDEAKLTVSGTGVVGFDGELTLVSLSATNFEIKAKVPYQGTTVDANVKMLPQ
jgi:hypothetical protein